jgi:hypothetical protein
MEKISDPAQARETEGGGGRKEVRVVCVSQRKCR